MSDPTNQISLELLGERVEIPTEELDPLTSPHSGRTLRRLELQIKVPEGRSDELRAELNRARDHDGALVGTDEERWLVLASSYSYTQGSGVHEYDVELGQDEEVRAERLELLGLDLVPTRYQEEFEVDGQLVVTCEVRPPVELSERLEVEIARDRDELYFDVVRHGVDETPLRMRFGRCLWQEEGDTRAHLIVLVSERGDDEIRRGGILLQPEFGNLVDKTLAAEETLGLLLGHLEASGALGTEALAEIRGAADESGRTRWRDLDRTEDLGRYF